ncbi:MAG: SufD family Fe-S cluster assembly protein [Patescibacteria group bacterium]|nr:SufD family Fe-S cluster assembly protein [Patescibacteria group bacterium]
MANLPKDFIKTAKICGLEHVLHSKGHLYIEKNKVLSHKMPKGIKIEIAEMPAGIRVNVTVKKGVKTKEPLFFCFGLKGKSDEQFIMPNILVEDGADVCVFTHCSFPKAVSISHKMEAVFKIGKNAKFYYEEHHFHGSRSGAMVIPKLKLFVEDGGYFNSNFLLTKGSVGQTSIELDAVLKANARIEIETKVLGKNSKDIVSIVDKVVLEGENSRSLIKMRAAAKDGGKVFMQGETYARSAGAIGHIDCHEIVSGKSVAKAVPIVEVSNDQARITHEASVGKINQKELETLMTRGLNEEKATELIIEAMMRE